jgi:hypothetical protein
VRGFVFDAGAFIALEWRAPLLLGILDEALHSTVQIVLPRTVIAQVWRGGPRQANVGYKNNKKKKKNDVKIRKN